MASFVKVHSFIEAAHEKVHNLGSDTLKWMLVNAAGSTAVTQKSDLTEISAGNGYTAGGATMTVTTSAQASGVYRLIGNNVSWTASGGSIATFRTAYLYNDTATNDEVLGYIDFGYGITVGISQTFTIDLDQINGVFFNT